MPKAPAWTKKDIPNQDGKIVIITGGTGGLGYETGLALAEAGAEVLLAGRNETKGTEAVEKIKTAFPSAKISFGKVDLGSLVSVKEFSENYNNKNKALDILVNNAGIMMPPSRQTTSDGFEIQFGTNHLAHFALTAYLIPSLKRSSSPRVVNVSSGASKIGKIHFEDLQSEKSYVNWISYAQSKLSNLLFTAEFQRKSEAGEWGINAYSAHPGFSRTELISNGLGNSAFFAKVSNNLLKPIFSQSASEGALPQLFAATSPDAIPGGYYGPNKFLELKGPPGSAKIPNAAKNVETAKKLWDVSIELTGVTWP